MRSLKCPVVKGNHDSDVSSSEEIQKMNPVAMAASIWTRAQLTQHELLWLHDLPLVEQIDSRVTIVHATLKDPSSWLYILDIIDACDSMNLQTSKICFHGHTHQPRSFVSSPQNFTRELEGVEIRLSAQYKYFINTGSVGQPRDGDPRACYAVFDMDPTPSRRLRYSLGSGEDPGRRTSRNIGPKAGNR